MIFMGLARVQAAQPDVVEPALPGEYHGIGVLGEELMMKPRSSRRVGGRATRKYRTGSSPRSRIALIVRSVFLSLARSRRVHLDSCTCRVSN
jgi:hypothetical protein